MSAIYSLLSAAKVQERNLEVTSNNLANINTNAFKADKAVFREFLKNAQTHDLNDEDELMQNPYLADYPNGNSRYVITDNVSSDMSAGSYQNTDNPYDLAIKGEGFFTISTPQGIRYTKDGEFQKSIDNYLVDASGNYVLGTGGAIEISGKNFNVTEDGLIQIDNVILDRLQIVNFQNPATLTKVGKSYYLPDEYNQILDVADNVQIKQGMLEKSNVSLVNNMLDLIVADRSFKAVQRGIQTMDNIDQQSLTMGR